MPGLLKLYRSKKGALGEDMEDILDKLDEQVSAPLPDIFRREYTFVITEKNVGFSQNTSMEMNVISHYFVFIWRYFI